MQANVLCIWEPTCMKREINNVAGASFGPSVYYSRIQWMTNATFGQLTENFHEQRKYFDCKVEAEVVKGAENTIGIGTNDHGTGWCALERQCIEGKWKYIIFCWSKSSLLSLKIQKLSVWTMDNRDYMREMWHTEMSFVFMPHRKWIFAWVVYLVLRFSEWNT